MTVYVDHTHLGRRHVTGIERITAELFSERSLAPIALRPVTARGTAHMMLTQTLGFPARIADPKAVLLCPGFPPSPLLLPFARRVIPYIHDLFLITRSDDLNVRAKLYMARPFRLAVRRYPRFLVNSLDTAHKLAAYCRRDAEVVVYRPKVRNVFEASPIDRNQPRDKAAIRLLSIGTVEPRKNYAFAARILRELRNAGFAKATLDVIGRNGWGDDWRLLEREPGVTLLGYASAEEVRHRLQHADALLCTSHEEGLGLPLLEAQYAGLPIIAPDDSIFREVLGESGVFIDRADAGPAATAIAAAIQPRDHVVRFRELNARNLTRWNLLAEDDRARVSRMIASLITPDSQPSSRHSRRMTAPGGHRN